MAKRILVTGSEGLLGSLLCKRLTKLGHSLSEVDLKLSGDLPGCVDISKSNLDQFVSQCDGIVHLAAVSRVVWGERDPIRCREVNVEATKRLLETVFASPQKPWFIYASSREVYGQQKLLPVREDVQLQPMNHYAQSKIDAEKLVSQARENGLQTIVLRFSNVFGNTNDHKDRVIPAFCLGAIRDEILRVDGFNHTFDFTHVSDVVRGILNVIDLLIQGDNTLPPIHFTSNRGITLGEAAEIITTLSKSNARAIEGVPRSFDVSSFIGDNSRAKKILGWSPEIPFEEGVSLDRSQARLFYKIPYSNHVS